MAQKGCKFIHTKHGKRCMCKGRGKRVKFAKLSKCVCRKRRAKKA